MFLKHMCMVGAWIITLLGFSSIYKYIVKHFVPSIVKSIIIMIVELTLLPSVVTSNIYTTSNNLTINQNVLLAFITVCILTLFFMLGVYFNSYGKFFRICSIIIDLVSGSIVAYFMWGQTLVQLKMFHFLVYQVLHL